MAGDRIELEEAYERLMVWTRSLLAASESCLPQIRKAIDPSEEIPENCPSHASMASLIFGDVRKKLREVEGAVEDIEKAIWGR